MLIQTNSNYPVIAERNRRIHVPTSVGEVACYHGHATAVAPARRGTNEYLAERAAQIKAVDTPTVSWIIRADTQGGDSTKRPAIYATCSNAMCAARFRYEGKPEQAVTVVFTHSCGPHVPTKVPADIVEQYRIACQKYPLLTVPSDEAAVMRYASHKNEDSCRREINHGNGMFSLDGQLFEKKK
jgi:hypothetical protein